MRVALGSGHSGILKGTESVNKMNRRFLLKSMGSMMAMAAASPSSRLQSQVAKPQTTSSQPLDDRVRELLKNFAFTKKDVDDLLMGNNSSNYISRKYDPVLGYVFWNCRFAHGIDGSICTYTYEPSRQGTAGARLMMTNSDKPCRINTYGDSLTHGDQVNDGETWQERLAAHLGEPVRNFGVGNYSVYQAYLRMQWEEAQKPAKYIIITFYDDDHRRSLQPLIPGFGIRPYLRVDADAALCEEHANPWPTPYSLYQLCDLDWLYENFRDFVRVYLKKYSASGESPEKKSGMFKIFGKSLAESSVKFYYDFNPSPALVRDALFGTMYLVEKIEAFAASTGSKVLYVLAYGPTRTRETLLSGQRFDQSFVDFLRNKNVPYVDLMDLHAKDFAMFKIDVDDYLRRYHVHDGVHYNPAGNAFMAFAIKEKILTLLNPKPPAYSADEV
jgi:lysophospholipase L1-like esterase